MIKQLALESLCTEALTGLFTTAGAAEVEHSVFSNVFNWWTRILGDTEFRTLLQTDWQTLSVNKRVSGCAAVGEMNWSSSPSSRLDHVFINAAEWGRARRWRCLHGEKLFHYPAYIWEHWNNCWLSFDVSEFDLCRIQTEDTVSIPHHSIVCIIEVTLKHSGACKASYVCSTSFLLPWSVKCVPFPDTVQRQTVHVLDLSVIRH